MKQELKNYIKEINNKLFKDAWLANEIELRKADNTRPEEVMDNDALYLSDCVKAYEKVIGIIDSIDSAEYCKDILTRLIDRKPLTPIENGKDDWVYLMDDPRYFQHKRYGSLLKTLNGATGKFTYFDVDKYDILDFKTSKQIYESWTRNVIEWLTKHDPIEFPYIPPTHNIKVYVTKLEDGTIYIHGWIDIDKQLYKDLGARIRYQFKKPTREEMDKLVVNKEEK